MPYTLYTCIHSVKERCLAWLFVVGEKEVKEVECLLLCSGRLAFLEQAVRSHEQLLWLFDNSVESFKKATNMLWERSSFISHSIFVRQTPFPTCCPEKSLCATLFLRKENSNFLFPYLCGTPWRIAKAKHRDWVIHAFKANDMQLEESAKQLLFWSRQWSESARSATDGSFDVGLGKTLRVGDSLLSTN